MITVPLDLCAARSVSNCSLGHIKKSSNDDSLVIDSSADAVSLDRDKKLPAPADYYDSELEVGETQFDESETGEMSNGEFVDVLEFGSCRFVAQQTQGCSTDNSKEGAKWRVRVRALPFRRARFVPQR